MRQHNTTVDLRPPEQSDNDAESTWAPPVKMLAQDMKGQNNNNNNNKVTGSVRYSSGTTVITDNDTNRKSQKANTSVINLVGCEPLYQTDNS